MISIRQIQQATAEEYGITRSDILGPSKRRIFAWPRQIAMHIVKTKTEQSYNQIGLAFGGRDHTTAMHSVTAVNDRMDDETRIHIRQIIRSIPAMNERELGGVFRSVRAQQPIFKTARNAQ